MLCHIFKSILLNLTLSTWLCNKRSLHFQKQQQWNKNKPTTCLCCDALCLEMPTHLRSARHADWLMSSKPASCFISNAGGDTRERISHILKSRCLFLFPFRSYFFFFLSCKLPPRSLRRGRRRRRHQAANSLPPTLLPLFLSRLSLCPGSGSHRHSKRPPCVLFALGPQHLHYQPIAYITARWGRVCLAHAQFPRDFKKFSLGET